MDHNARTPTIMAYYSEFDPSNFLNYEEEKLDIFIQNNNIYVMTAPKKIHESTSIEISKIIDSALEKLETNEYVFKGYGTADIMLYNYLNCCPQFIKQPDFSFNTSPPGKRKDASIVGEIARTNEDFKLLLDEIDCYLNEFTHIEYAIGLIFLEHNRFNIQFIVGKRRKLQKFFANSIEESDFIEEKKQQKKYTKEPTPKYKSNVNYDASELIKMKTKEIQEIYNFDIICNENRTEQNINTPIEFEIDVAALLNGTSFVSSTESMKITISPRILNSILIEFNRNI